MFIHESNNKSYAFQGQKEKKEEPSSKYNGH